MPAPAVDGAAQPQLPDASASSLWRRLPASWTPYVQLARLDRPAGWQLLLAPCLSSICLACIYRLENPNYGLLALFFIGAVAMRGAGSTFNDLIDRKIDARVERTAARPLPSGRVSPRNAAIFMAAQGLVGLAVLLSFNRFAILLGLLSLVPVAIYPFMKRFTSWPQAALGLAFSWGALLGWAAQTGGLAAPALWLYASCVAWTIGYDTIYAIQDRKDDVAAGVKSTALLFGEHVQLAVAVFYLLTVLCAEVALVLAGAGLAAHLGLLAFASHLVWQIRGLDADDEAKALRLFRSNGLAGFLLSVGLFTENLLFYLVR
ncbi:4-hydroxybenzoate octaprenyltransferase [Rhodoblastus acidophilus]|uniref:4-hydroxybenzoate octaprenyltransferase n=1 Tax=Candidatus Rhodoblastus alkanivorans TaxID=2954117 RepID=A0ABS9Z7D8_9HYPH|nr:4-hydroxybenzoate octaprenyltransferase [Candidatus Rhodoblastus alkanivorans]MCI4677686.1 4-hydroxybenzoate octaprenyltransferase [Candidatus Rhodoblastus alkanivorans]MCI4682582.1 4-hydroxybenzoate octaprenyltransferase [Candidatus Rhodoblastus alkanivorans]MDI4639888.1 4-hydroxybenzoate octaprenyltransferase [Rhodoblastus acidophilus]